jgi:hypothetical protein
MKILFAVSETGPEAAAGDYFTALELGQALADRFGWDVTYRPHGEGWYELAGFDLLIALREDYDLRAVRNAQPGLVKIAWARNWFERWCEQTLLPVFDVLLASSRQSAGFISQRVGKRAGVLRIATNPERFNTLERPVQPALDFVFTGSYWQAERDVIAALTALPEAFRGAIYGRHWEQVPALAARYRGFLPYARIHESYRDAAVVIDDANHVTKAWGAANSRVFDALAAGCLVITNSASVSQEVFAGRLPVYHSPAELAELLAYYRHHAAERDALQQSLRQEVQRRHLYRHRAFELGLQLEAYARTRQGPGHPALLAALQRNR